MRLRQWGLCTAVMALLAPPAWAQQAQPEWTTSPRDWSATLKGDVDALGRIIEETHPGLYDDRNPAFRQRVEAGLAEARERAETTTDAGGWWWAMRGLIAGFEDGHVDIGLTNQGGFPTRWPGFLTVYQGADQVVASRDEADRDSPPLGARLIACDGVDAATLAERRVGAFRGRWVLEAQKVQFGDWVFMSPSNPWIPEMSECRFETQGVARSYRLNWRAIEAQDLGARRTALAQRVSPGFGMKTLDDGGVWLSMPSFNGDPASEAYAALTTLLTQATENQARLRAAPYVVLDVRDNGGGSSHWSARLALTLWGGDWATTHPLAPIESVEWRASEANIAGLKAFRDQLTAANGDPQMIAWADNAIAGMQNAIAVGEPLWRDQNTPETPPTYPVPPENPMKGTVYVLTDFRCGSACLDAVDLWKTLGAVQIGRETNADTVYMELREAALPSGLARVWIPMKVYRGRARGNNEPQIPAHAYAGNMADEQALQAWVRELQAAD
ncbi:S41 family peptidase [Brevundimonas sp.]|uniref:S41 family peptidase n=1 Tax=Brevundimonas sp. TaxID=1871086 RepID=UPI0025C3A311|nr:S41 family peptidase [Brevundimonas sp.]